MNKKNKQILLVSPRGFCAGVTRAVDVVLETLKQHGSPVYVKHEIVHNKHVIKDLEQKGTIFIEDVESVPSDRPLIISAHGVSKKVINASKKNNSITIDATCPLVTKVHVQAQKFFNEGLKIILIGHKNHPEVEGTMGQLPDGSIFLIEKISDIQKLDFNSEDKIAYITQTTLSVDDTNSIILELKQRYPNIKSSPKEDICYATTNRQNAIKAHAYKCDSFIVIGSKNSSNSNRLVEVATNSGCKNACLLEDASQLNLEEYNNAKIIGISSGASVPDILVEDVVEKFEQYFDVVVDRVIYGEENVNFKLPKELRK
tara:strand:- start:569 stop:1513 length:945 start_codon:yes stop_codon:yes gene_type:complete